MIKRLFLFMLIFTFSTTVFCVDAHAQPKIDGPNFVQRIKARFEKIAAKIQVIAQKIKKFFQEGIMGKVKTLKERADKLKAKYDRLKAKLDKVTARVNKARAKIERVKARIEKVKTKIEEVKALYEEGKALVEGTIANVKEGIETVKDTVNDVKNTVEDAIAPALDAKILATKKSEINTKYEQEVLVIEEKYTKQLADIDKEIAIAQEAGDVALLAERKKDKETALKEKAEELAVAEETKNSALAVVDEELKSLAEKTLENNKGALDFLSKKATKTSVFSVADLNKKYFADVDSIDEKVRVENAREELALQDVIYLLELSLNIISEIPEQEKEVDELMVDVLKSEYTPSISASVEIDILNMRNMVKNIRMKAAQLRKDTTEELAKHKGKKSNPGTKDIQNFDIEDYNYAKNCKESFLNKAKGFAEKTIKEGGVGGVDIKDLEKVKEEISNAKI